MKDNYKSRIMKNLFNYWFKTNKKSLYDQLGKEFNVSGFRVYKLAHGKTAHSQGIIVMINIEDYDRIEVETELFPSDDLQKFL